MKGVKKGKEFIGEWRTSVHKVFKDMINAKRKPLMKEHAYQSLSIILQRSEVALSPFLLTLFQL
jgi:hypothetical protein